MRKTLLMSAAVLALASGTAFAQTAMPTPDTAQPPAAGMPMDHSKPMRHRPGAMHQKMMNQSVAAEGTDAMAPPTSAYQGGAGSPSSTAASNTTSANTRSEIAPRLPNPDASGNTVEAFLASAQRALNQGKTGAAQEALERAETRALTRSTEPSMAGQPDNAMLVQHIGEARRALASRNTAGAKTAVSMAMAGGSAQRMPMNGPVGGPMAEPGLGASPARGY